MKIIVFEYSYNNMLREKRGQGGINAAILVAILAAFIIAYILFLPQDDRDDLLDGKSLSSIDHSRDDNEITLLEEGVGRLDPVGKVRDIDLPNINIFETTNAKVLDTINPFTIRNGWFDKKSKTTSFTVNDIENIENVILSFNAPTRKGIISINLNGQSLYEYRVPTINVAPIKIKKSLIQQQNTISFSVSSVGGKFWATNEYSLDNIKIIGDVSDRSRQESQNVFTLSGKESQNIEKSEIRFTPYCFGELNVGILDLTLNNRNIFSALPVCNDRYKVDLPPSALSSGINKIRFKTDKGSYSIEQVKLSFTEKDTPETVFFFDVNKSTFDKIENDTHEAIFKILFVDEDEVKRADININDRFIRIDQFVKSFERKINNLIVEDNNFIKVTPRNVINVVEVRVDLREKND